LVAKNTALSNKSLLLISQLGETVTSASDVWSFGVVVWEILTLGSLPFGDYSHQQIIIKVPRGVYSFLWTFGAAEASWHFSIL
jgi:hypothetical protein